MDGPEYRFDVFGRRIAVRATGVDSPRWSTFLLGAEGKRRPAGFVVPDFIGPDELRQYLADLFHESAKRSNDEVRPLPGPP